MPHCYFIRFTSRLYYYKIIFRLSTDNKNLNGMHHCGLVYVLLKHREVVLNGPQQAEPNGPVHSVPILNSVLLSSSLLHSFIAVFLL